MVHLIVAFWVVGLSVGDVSSVVAAPSENSTSGKDPASSAISSGTGSISEGVVNPSEDDFTVSVLVEGRLFAFVKRTLSV